MTIVGSASVKIHADVSGLAADIQRQLGGLDKIGKDIGKSIGKNLRSGIEDGLGDTNSLFDGLAKDAGNKGKDAGNAFGKGFADSAKSHINGATDGLGSGMGKNVADDFNSGFQSNLNIGNSIAEEMESGAQKGSRGVESAVSDSMSDGAKKGGDAAAAEMGNAGRRGGDNYGKSFSQSLDKWMGSRGSGGPFEGKIAGLAENIIQIQILQGALAGVVSAASAAAGAIISLGSALVYAAPAALQFGNVLAALAQGMLVAKSLFSGVGEGLKAYGTAQTASIAPTKAATKATQGSTKALMSEEERLLRIREARDALNDAIIEGARANEDAIESVSDAQEAVSDALEDTRDAQEAYTDAIEDQSDAQRDLMDAMEDEQKALRELNDARAEAQERLEDLQLSLERASLNEERAALNLTKAEQKLREAQAGGNANAIYEADLAYREQLQTVKELQESNGDLRDEANKAQAEGVDGTQDVIDAQRDHRDAVEATSDAQEALSDAIEATSDAQEAVRDSIEATSDAQRDLARATEDVGRIAEDVSIRIARAQLNLKKALEGTGDALTGIGAAGGPAAAGIGKVQNAFDKLNPVVQDFVRFLENEFLPPFRAIQELGQEEFFPRFEQALRGIIDNTELMRILEETYVDTSIALGDLSIKLSEAFEVPATLEALETILDSNIVILENLGQAATNLVQPLSQIFAATAPLAERWSQSIEDATASFQDFIAEQAAAPIGGGQSPLEQFFENAERLAGKLWDVLKNLGGIAGGIFEAALPAGEYFLDRMITMTEGWKESIDESQAALSGVFLGASANFADILDLIGAIVGQFLLLGGNPAIGEIARAAKELVPILGALAQDGFDQIAPAIIRVLDSIEPLLALFSETETIKIFADAIATVVEVIAAVAEVFLKWGGSDETLKVIGWIGGLTAAFSLVVGLGGRVVQKLNGVWGSLKAGAKVVGAIPSGISKAWSGLKNLPSTISKTLSGLKNVFKGDFSIFKKKPKAKSEAAQAVEDSFAGVEETLRRETEKVQRAAREAGEDVVKGLAEGIRSEKRKLLDEVEDLTDDVIKKIDDGLGTHSISDKTEKDGEELVGGLVEGIDDNTSKAVTEADQLSKAVVDELKEGMRQGGIDAGDALTDGVVLELETSEGELERAAGEARRAVTDSIDDGMALAGTDAVDDMTDAMKAKMELDESTLSASAMEQARAIERAAKPLFREGGEDSGDAWGEGAEGGIERSSREINAEIRELVRGGNAAAVATGGIDLDVDIPRSETTEVNTKVRELVRAGERTADGMGGIDINVDIPVGEMAAINAEIRRIVLAAEGTAAAMGGIDIDVDANATGGRGRKGGARGKNDVDLDADGNMLDKKGNRIDADGRVIEGKRAGKKGKGVKAVGGKVVKKGGIKAATAALTAAPIPGARIVAGALAAGTALNTLGQRAQEGMTEAEIEAMSTWDTIGLGWSSLWQGAERVFSTFFSETLPNFWNNTVVPWWHSIWAGLGEGWSTLWDDAFASISTFFSDTIPNWWNNTVVPWWHGIWADLGQGWSDLWTGAFDTIVKFFSEDIPNWWNTTVVPWWNGIWEDLGAGWSETWNGIWDTLQGLWNNTIWPWITGIPARVKEKLQNAFNSFSKAFSDAWESIKGLWNNTIWPWITGIPGRIKEKLSNSFDSFSQSITDAWNKIKGLWDNTIWPWIKSVPGDISDKLKSSFNGLIEGFDTVMSKVSSAWNTAMGQLERLPFVDPGSLPRWNYTKIGGYAEGGLVDGPDRGPKADNVLAALTPGEYVLPRRMVDQIGAGNLDAWRRGGGGSARGGLDLGEKVAGKWKEAKDWSKEKKEQLTQMATKGALTLVTPILKGLSSVLPDNKFFKKFVDWLLGGKAMEKWTNNLNEQAKATEEQRKAEEEAAAAAKAGGGTPYTGPPGGWAHPLGGKGSPRTYSGHSNTGAYDWAVPSGTHIVAVTRGKIITSKDLQGSYGRYIKISHKGDTSLYAHMSSRIGKVGQEVIAGQLIGKVGSTGNSTGPHLHLEISPPKNTVSVLKSHGVKMAKGGIVPAMSGGLLTVIGEAGRAERVTPLDNQGRSATEVQMLAVLEQMAAQRSTGGDTFNVFPSPGMDERELAGRVSRQIAIQHRRRS